MNDVTPGAGWRSVAIYLRGSSANRRWQRAECKNFAAAHYGGVPVEFYEDGERCADGRWSEADRLMLDLDAGALAAVIIKYGRPDSSACRPRSSGWPSPGYPFTACTARTSTCRRLTAASDSAWWRPWNWTRLRHAVRAPGTWAGAAGTAGTAKAMFPMADSRQRRAEATIALVSRLQGSRPRRSRAARKRPARRRRTGPGGLPWLWFTAFSWLLVTPPSWPRRKSGPANHRPYCSSMTACPALEPGSGLDRVRHGWPPHTARTAPRARTAAGR